MKSLTSYIDSWGEKIHRPYALRLFSLLIYLWFLLQGMMVWSTRHYLWGPQNIIFRQGHADGFIENFAYQLIYDTTRFPFIFYGHLLAAFISLFEFKWSFISRGITWITAIMLYYGAIEAFNSGMMLMMLFAFYSIFLYTKTHNPYVSMLANFVWLACILQLCLVYVCSAAYKLGGTQWLEGSAFYYAIHIERFSSAFWTKTGLIQSSFAMAFLTWMGLLYQAVFPVAVWFGKIRKWLLPVGICFHLFIGIFLHLWDFALAMIFSYSLFVQEATARKFLVFRTLRK